MRAKIPHSLRERRHQRRRRGRRTARAVRPATPLPRLSDQAVKRVREAGGPVDQAFYNCECGYVFVAAVSTSVECPHCHTGQAW
jgi:hypothetical protein